MVQGAGVHLPMLSCSSDCSWCLRRTARQPSACLGVGVAWGDCMPGTLGASGAWCPARFLGLFASTGKAREFWMQEQWPEVPCDQASRASEGWKKQHGMTKIFTGWVPAGPEVVGRKREEGIMLAMVSLGSSAVLTNRAGLAVEVYYTTAAANVSHEQDLEAALALEAQQVTSPGAVKGLNSQAWKERRMVVSPWTGWEGNESQGAGGEEGSEAMCREEKERDRAGESCSTRGEQGTEEGARPPWPGLGWQRDSARSRKWGRA